MRKVLLKHPLHQPLADIPRVELPSTVTLIVPGLILATALLSGLGARFALFGALLADHFALFAISSFAFDECQRLRLDAIIAGRPLRFGVAAYCEEMKSDMTQRAGNLMRSYLPDLHRRVTSRVCSHPAELSFS